MRQLRKCYHVCKCIQDMQGVSLFVPLKVDILFVEEEALHDLHVDNAEVATIQILRCCKQLELCL